MKHVFVFDPKTFRKQQWKMDNILDSIGQFFRTQEHSDFSIQISRYRRNAITLIQRDVETAGDDDTVRVYAIGGDDILFDCLNGVAEVSNTELTPVPYGEASDFLHNFGEEKDELFRDIPALVQRSTVNPTDIISWGINYALNACFIGLPSAAASKLRESNTALDKRGFSVFSRILSSINNILMVFDKQIAAQYYKITIDGKDFSGNYSLIHIANGPYFEGKITGLSKAALDDGLLDVALLRSTGPLRTMWALRRYFRGKTSSNCVILHAKKIAVRSDRRMWIQMDNEHIQDTEVNINIVPHAVQIVAADNLSYQKPQEVTNGKR